MLLVYKFITEELLTIFLYDIYTQNDDTIGHLWKSCPFRLWGIASGDLYVFRPPKSHRSLGSSYQQEYTNIDECSFKTMYK